jgi:hypothetical protein
MYLVHKGIQKDQGLDQGLEEIREPTGLGPNIDFESLYLVHTPLDQLSAYKARVTTH